MALHKRRVYPYVLLLFMFIHLISVSHLFADILFISSTWLPSRHEALPVNEHHVCVKSKTICPCRYMYMNLAFGKRHLFTHMLFLFIFIELISVRHLFVCWYCGDSFNLTALQTRVVKLLLCAYYYYYYYYFIYLNSLLLLLLLLRHIFKQPITITITITRKIKTAYYYYYYYYFPYYYYYYYFSNYYNYFPDYYYYFPILLHYCWTKQTQHTQIIKTFITSLYHTLLQILSQKISDMYI